MAEPRLDTAHQSWDRGWGQAETRARWVDAELAVTELIPALQYRGARRVVDVGTGIGRHALAFARAGFEVIAVDATTLTAMLRAAHLEARSLVDIDQQPPGAFHWTVLADAVPNGGGGRHDG